MTGKLWGIAKSRFFCGVLLALASYCCIALTLSSKQTVVFFNCIQIMVAVAVIAAYGPAWAYAITHDRFAKSDCLSLGVFLAWLSIVLVRGYGILMRSTYDYAIMDTYLFGFFVWIGIIAGIMHLVAVRSYVMFSTIRRVLLPIVLGVLLALFVLLYRPDFGHILRSILKFG